MGAGPAGAALAHLLARRHRVALIDAQTTPAPRIGESLIPAARRLLRDMGLLQRVSDRRYLPYLGNQSAWGDDRLEVTDFLRDPDGPGWHLDRADFETTLRNAGCQAGAEMRIPARLTGCQRRGDLWDISLSEGPDLQARIVVDTTGRKASVARMLGMRPQIGGRMVAVWMRLAPGPGPAPDQGLSTIAACADGWWYTAPLGDARVLALHTDSDLLPATLRQGHALLEAARAQTTLAPLLRGCMEAVEDTLTISAASSQSLPQCAGPGWLAAGDAAMAPDPLSSRGIFQSLYSALAAATEIDAALDAGKIGSFNFYAAHMKGISNRYAKQLDLYYRAEQRWPDAPFWRRRSAV